METKSQSNKRWIIAAAIGVAVLLLLAYLASPWLALARLRADAQARRTDRMSRHIDFPAVRASVKAQVLARLQEEIPADAANTAWGTVGMALASAVLEPAVYALASPQGLMAMMNGENPLPGFDRLGIAMPQAATAPLHAESNGPDKADAGRDQAQSQEPTNRAAVPMPEGTKRPWRLRYEGLNRVVIQRQPAQAGEPYLLMHRRGLFGWQVVDVQLGRLW